jgi:AMMECR1 domain-containing protein
MRVTLAKYKEKHIKIYIRKSKMRKKQCEAKFSHNRIVFVALRQHSQEREHARLGLASSASLPRQKLADMAINCGFYEVWQSAYLKFLVS